MNKTRSITPTPGGSSLAKVPIRNENFDKKKPITNNAVNIINRNMAEAHKNDDFDLDDMKNIEIIDKIPSENLTKSLSKPIEMKKNNANLNKSVTETPYNPSYNLKTPPSRKEKLENISTIPALSETLNSTVENSGIQKDLDEMPMKRRDTFGFKSTGFEENNVLVSLISEENEEKEEKEKEEKEKERRKLESFKEENRSLC